MSDYFVPSQKHLGKFVSSEALGLVLQNRSLKWSRPDLFNDPFDCQPRFRFCPSLEECLPLLRQEILRALAGDIKSYAVDGPFSKKVNWVLDQIKLDRAKPNALNFLLEGVLAEAVKNPEDMQNKFFDQVVGQLESSKIICFTKNFLSVLMWSHYGESHRGALLGFLPRSDDSQFKLAEKVRYTKSLPFMMEAPELAKAFTGQVSLGDDVQTARTLDRAVFTKALEWEYENEWRITGGDGFQKHDKVEYNKFDAEDLSFVVLGCKASDELICKCITFRDSIAPHLEIYKAQRTIDRFELNFVKT
jgi:Protein of unknown function (DUF2971)